MSIFEKKQQKLAANIFLMFVSTVLNGWS